MGLLKAHLRSKLVGLARSNWPLVFLRRLKWQEQLEVQLVLCTFLFTSYPYSFQNQTFFCLKILELLWNFSFRMFLMVFLLVDPNQKFSMFSKYLVLTEILWFYHYHFLKQSLNDLQYFLDFSHLIDQLYLLVAHSWWFMANKSWFQMAFSRSKWSSSKNLPALTP